jgi:hypothetical protein
MDLGSGGPVLIPSLGLVVGAGKDGVLYVLDRTAMGKTRPADLPHPATNYAKLKSPPIFFTYFPPNLKPGPDDITTLNVLFAGRTHHLHGNPLYWDSPDHGPMLFCWGENENLRAWSVAPGRRRDLPGPRRGAGLGAVERSPRWHARRNAHVVGEWIKGA